MTLVSVVHEQGAAPGTPGAASRAPVSRPRDAAILLEEFTNMIDAAYFRTKFATHAAQTGPKVRAEVHLRGGSFYEIEAVREVEEGYVVLRVYPTEPREGGRGDSWTRRMDLDEPPVALDRVVIPYESIACIHVYPVEGDSSRTVGFQTGASPRAG